MTKKVIRLRHRNKYLPEHLIEDMPYDVLAPNKEGGNLYCTSSCAVKAGENTAILRTLEPEEFFDKWEKDGELRLGQFCKQCNGELNCYGAEDPKEGQRDWSQGK